MPPPRSVHPWSRVAEPGFLKERLCLCSELGGHQGKSCGQVPVYVEHKNTPTDEKRKEVVDAWRALVRSVAGEREAYVHVWVYCALKGETRFGKGDFEMKRERGRTYKHHLASALVLHGSPNSACRQLFVEVLSGFYPENQVQRVECDETNIQQYYFDKRLLICDQLNYEKHRAVLERALKLTSFCRSINSGGYEPDKQAGTKARGRPQKNDYCYFDGVSFTRSYSTKVREKDPHLLTYRDKKYELLPRTQFVILSDALTFESQQFRVVHEEGGDFNGSVLRDDDDTRAILSSYYKSAWLKTSEAKCRKTWNYKPNENTTLSMRWLRKLVSDSSSECDVIKMSLSQLMEHYNSFVTEVGAPQHLLYTDNERSFGWFMRDLIKVQKVPFTKTRIQKGGKDIVGYTYVARDIGKVVHG